MKAGVFMKYGLIYYHNTFNIGDDILSYAAKQFLPHVDYYIAREHLDVFVPNECEYVAVIVNGWYLHLNYTFQPSPYLYPFFIGTHFSKDQLICNDYSWIDTSVQDYLRKYMPIGCRDYHTADVLAARNIDSYFSGCLTLTLPKFTDIQPNHTAFLVDLPEPAMQYIKNLCPNQNFTTKTHRYTELEACSNWNIRENRVIELLKTYQGANFVITTRLHCALPCLALGTPVVLLTNDYDEDFDSRIKCFADFLPIYSIKELLEHKADTAILFPNNSDDVISIAKKLREQCHHFINQTQSTYIDAQSLPTVYDYKTLYIDRTQYMRKAIHTLYVQKEQLLQQILQDSTQMEKIIALTNKVLNENEFLKKELHQS